MLTSNRYESINDALSALESTGELQITIINLVIKSIDSVLERHAMENETLEEYTKIRLRLEDMCIERQHIREYVILLRAILLQSFKPLLVEEPCKLKTI